MALSTITGQKLANFCSTHLDLLPVAGVGGYTDEPFLSIFNDSISDLITWGNDWKFNSIFMPMFVTCPNRQDYQFGGATAFTLGATSTGAGIGLVGNNAIVESGTTVTVTTLEQHRFSVGDTVYMIGNTVSSYNSVFTDTGSATSWSGGWVITAVPSLTTFTFTHLSSGLANSGAPGITDFGWMTSASMVEMNNTSSPQNIKHLEAVKDVVPWSRVSNPEKVAMVRDNGDGTIRLRFYQVPGTTIWGVNIVYQAKAPLKVSLTDTITPFPDNFQAVVRQAALYRCYRYINSPRAEVEFQKLQQEIQKAQGFDDNEQSNVFVTPAESLMDDNYWSY